MGVGFTDNGEQKQQPQPSPCTAGHTVGPQLLFAQALGPLSRCSDTRAALWEGAAAALDLSGKKFTSRGLIAVKNSFSVSQGFL